MKYRVLGKTGYQVSEIGYGAWSLGADWGNISEEQAIETLAAVKKSGVNFIDTADVYGDGRSEKLIKSFLGTDEKKAVFVATKTGRRLDPHVTEGYTRENIRGFVDRSLVNLGTKCLDLLQLHCPPTQVYYRPEVFAVLDELVEQKKIRYYGVSVEKVEEALKAIQYPNVATVQIIFNMFRQRPLELFFGEAVKRNVGIIVRVPLASGLLTGKMDDHTTFSKNDHREFNRHGQAFDVGETFAGVEFETGLSAVKELKKMKPENYTMSQFALKWILMHQAVSTVIVGGKTAAQVMENAGASELPSLHKNVMNTVEKIYTEHIKQSVHQRW